MTWWHSYWAWVGGNIGAMPLEFLITAVVTLVFRRPLTRAVKWVRDETASELHDHVAELHEEVIRLRQHLEARDVLGKLDLPPWATMKKEDHHHDHNA